MAKQLHQSNDNPDPQREEIRVNTEDDIKRIIGANIFKYRTKAGYTQGQMANCLQLSGDKKVSREETGQSYPNVKEIILYTSLFDAEANSIIPKIAKEDLDRIYGSSLCEEAAARISEDKCSAPDNTNIQDDREMMIGDLAEIARCLKTPQIKALLNIALCMNMGCVDDK